MPRPDFASFRTGAEFNNWYWLKAELMEICQQAGLPTNGSKFTLRDRIIYALDNEGAVMPEPKKPKPTSRFNWAKEKLRPETLITDNITFGQNFRGFMESQLGPHFICHTDFMKWVKAHPGYTLADAVTAWNMLEQRKTDPSFRSDIADHNMFNQYTRDFLDENPELGMAAVRHSWAKRREMPAPGGFIRYQPTDVDL